MPIKEYKCLDCETIMFEKWIGIDEEVKCRKCGRILKPLISKSSFVLKGGGWACSGYSKEKK